MRKKLWWRLGAIFLLVPALLASSGCKQSAKQAKAPEKKAELMKTPYKNEEFATGTYVEILIYDKGMVRKTLKLPENNSKNWQQSLKFMSKVKVN